MSDKILDVLRVRRVSVIVVILERLPRHCDEGGFSVNCEKRPLALKLKTEKNEVTGVGGEGEGGGVGTMQM